MAAYDQVWGVWPGMIEYIQIWPNVDEYGRIRGSMAKASPVWLVVAKYGQLRSIISPRMYEYYGVQYDQVCQI